jgi:hypothetical protein
MPTLDDIQNEYVAELRRVAPSLRDWWKRICLENGKEAMMKRWPTGISGHPQVLAIFRDYYFQIEQLNDETIDKENGDERPLSEDMWGEDDLGEEADIGDQTEMLILDIADIAPDIADVVDGICFVPVGLTPDEDPV